MKKALLRRKRRNPERMLLKRKPTPLFSSRKESGKRGKYTRSKIKQEMETIIRDEVPAL